MNLYTFILLVLFINQNYSKVIGAAILPHGDFALDPYLLNDPSLALKLKNSAIIIAKQIYKKNPDIIFLSTPHGYELKKSFLMYLNSELEGKYIMGSDLHDPDCRKCYELKMRLKGNMEIANDLVELLIKRNNKVEGLEGFADSNPLSFSWGELIPIKFLDIVYSKKNKSIPEVVMMGQPLKRIEHSVEMISELLKLGKDIGEYFENLNKNVFIIISSDLAHTHSEDGPYGYCKCAQLFDDSIKKYVESLDNEYLLKHAAYYQKIGAMSCGFTGIVMLEGLINNTKNSNKWTSKVYELSHPTYFGMMTALFENDNSLKK
jgi:aromatic ring-opening dioxygenase LigB subunit